MGPYEIEAAIVVYMPLILQTVHSMCSLDVTINFHLIELAIMHKNNFYYAWQFLFHTKLYR